MKKFYTMISSFIALGCFLEFSSAQNQTLQQNLTNSEASSNIKQNAITSLLNELATRKENQDEISLTLEEQNRLQAVIEEETIVPKKKGVLSGLGKSTNLTEGLTFAYGQYFREYFYNVIDLLGYVTTKLDDFEKSIIQTNATKGTVESRGLGNTITSFKLLLKELDTFCSHLLYCNRKKLDAAFPKLDSLFSNSYTFKKAIENALVPISDEKDTTQCDSLMASLRTLMEEIKDSVRELHNVFFEGEELSTEKALPEAAIKSLNKAQEKAKAYQKTFGELTKTKIQLEKDHEAKTKKKIAASLKEETLKKEVRELRLFMIKFIILADTIKKLQPSKRFSKTIREDTKKSIENSATILEKAIEMFKNLAGELVINRQSTAGDEQDN